MNKTNKIKTIAIIMLCLPFCGGWTTAPDNQADDRYVGGELISTYASSETISYVSREVVENISTANGTPLYSAVSGMQNGCGAVAGSIIVGFYDKYYANLIPDWDSYYSSGMYRIQNGTYVQTLLLDLYNRMQTNVVAPGVSEDEFKSGLRSYVTDHGYNLQYISLGAENNFNYSAFKAGISNNQPAVLLVQPSNFYLMNIKDNEDTITANTISGNHIMVAYGYYEVKYTLSNGIRTDKYLRVETGFSGSPTALYKVGSYIDAAYKVTIN